jgi:hypothetical protein
LGCWSPLIPVFRVRRQLEKDKLDYRVESSARLTPVSPVPFTPTAICLLQVEDLLCHILPLLVVQPGQGHSLLVLQISNGLLQTTYNTCGWQGPTA